MKRILWHNVPGRFWLWRHHLHGALNLTTKPWRCSCGARYPRARPAPKSVRRDLGHLSKWWQFVALFLAIGAVLNLFELDVSTAIAQALALCLLLELGHEIGRRRFAEQLLLQAHQHPPTRPEEGSA